MKFNSLLDIQLFLAEINCTDLVFNVDENFVPTEEQIDTFLKRRKKLIPGLKSFRKIQKGKEQWRKGRYKMLKAIRKFHKSTKGKRFHRNMSRFAISMIGRDKKTKSTIKDKVESLKSLSSAKTHLIIELGYYHTLAEQIELETFTYESFDLFNSIESKIIRDEHLTQHEEDFLCLLIENAALIKSLAQESGKSEDEVEAKWKSIKLDLEKQGKDENDKNFFGLLVSILKKQLEIK